METKQIETLSFIDKVKKFKNGNKDALDSIFQVVIDKEKHGISKILINDNELVKNYSNIMNKYKGVIPYDTRQQLFHMGLIESIYKMKECKSNKEALAYVQNGIIHKIRQHIDKANHEKQINSINEEMQKDKEKNASLIQQRQNNKYRYDYDVTDAYDKNSNAEVPQTWTDRASYQRYSHDDCPSKVSEFLKYCPIEDILTDKQMIVWKEIQNNPNATDEEIAKNLDNTQQNINNIRHTIRDKLKDCFDVFIKLNQHDTTRLTSSVIDFLDHIHKMKQYHDFADDDERLFPEIFDFIKKQYAYIDQLDSEIHKLFKNKHTYETTIDILLSDYWTAGNKPSVSAQKALSKLEKTIEKNDIKSINKRDSRRMVKHIIAALERYLVEFKADIIENARTNRIKREKKNNN